MARFPHSSKKRNKNYMHGGSTHSCPSGYMMQNGGCVPMNGGMYEHGGETHSCPSGMHMMQDGSCMQGAYHGASTGGGGYRRGGRINKRSSQVRPNRRR